MCSISIIFLRFLTIMCILMILEIILMFERHLKSPAVTNVHQTFKFNNDSVY